MKYVIVILLLTAAACTTPEMSRSLPDKLDTGNVGSERVNINTAGPEELEKIPKIGPKLAAKIISHRERHGSFRRPEHLMLVPGFSDKRFREVRHFIVAD